MPNFDLETLKKFLQDFYVLTNIKAKIFDAEGNELCSHPSKLSGFCEILQKDEKASLKCKECGKNAIDACRKMRSQCVYTCHAGLQEHISPVIYGNRIMGFIIIGQIKNDSEKTFLDFQGQFPEPMRRALRFAYDSLPKPSDEKLLSAFRVLGACAGYGLLNAPNKVSQTSIDKQIDKYIQDNLTAPLSVSSLCSRFHLSHYEIYNIFTEFFGCAPAEYIKHCRLTYACKLLATTDLPVNTVAVKCGIKDYNYFSKVFKSAYNLSPTAYRKKAVQTV